NQKTKMITLNAIIAAVYLALTVLVNPIASGAIQFRISESLNHLIVLNKRFIWGITLGVVTYNLLFSNLFDVAFGGAQTLMALGLTAWLGKYVKSIIKRMLINIIVFSLSMFMIAWMLV